MKGIIFLLWILVIVPVAATGQVLFSKTFSDTTQTEFSTGMILMPDSSIAYFKTRYKYIAPQLHSKGFQLVNFRNNGQVNFTRTYEDNSSLQYSSELLKDVIITRDTGFIALGIQRDSSTSAGILLYKLNAAGDLLWNTLIRLNGEAVFPRSVFETANSDLIVEAGSSLPGRPRFIARLTSAGVLIWAKTYSIPPYVYDATGVTEVNSELFVLFPLEENTQHFQCDFGLLKTDAAGNILSVHAVKDSLPVRVYKNMRLSSAGNNGFVITGIKSDSLSCDNGIFIMNFDSNGMKLWSKHYSVPTQLGQAMGAPSVSKQHDGSMLINFSYATSNDLYKWHNVIANIGVNGGIKWRHKFDMIGCASGSPLRSFDESIFYGITDVSQSASSVTNYIVKTDSSGISCEPQSPIFITGTYYSTYDSSMVMGSNIHPVTLASNVVNVSNSQLIEDSYCLSLSTNELPDTKVKSLTVYPNPSASFITVTKNAGSDVVVTDLPGKVVLKIRSDRQNEIYLNVSEWADGVYLIQSGNERIKFVKN